MPDKKDNGTITKFVTDAIWSNFSAHKPAIVPMFPNIKEDKKVNKINPSGRSYLSESLQLEGDIKSPGCIDNAGLV